MLEWCNKQYTDATSRNKVHLVLQLSWEPCILLRKLFLKLSGKESATNN